MLSLPFGLSVTSNDDSPYSFTFTDLHGFNLYGTSTTSNALVPFTIVGSTNTSDVYTTSGVSSNTMYATSTANPVTFNIVSTNPSTSYAADTYSDTVTVTVTPT